MYIKLHILNQGGDVMEVLLTKLTASLTELREPNKVIAKAGNQPVAILNRNEAIGYFVPKGALSDVEVKVATDAQIESFLNEELYKIDHVLEYLKDK
jgi:antitoxin StbD